MNSNAYTVLGWVTWQIGKRAARRKMADTRVKVAAAGVVALVLVAGLAAARAGSDD